ncbi:hypothetical protein KY330_02360 [Candidatus Woesearchaeota archaeon]|nr:hypothetical protein [Candidatus Woesearchaeota archaeon]
MATKKLKVEKVKRSYHLRLFFGAAFIVIALLQLVYGVETSLGYYNIVISLAIGLLFLLSAIKIRNRVLSKCKGKFVTVKYDTKKLRKRVLVVTIVQLIIGVILLFLGVYIWAVAFFIATGITLVKWFRCNKRR